jgi:hypothetical protein
MRLTTPDDLVLTIRDHAQRGRKAWQQDGDLKAAESLFLAAWDLVPEPKTDYDYGQILSRGIVTFYRDTKQFNKALTWLDVMRRAYGPEPNESVEFLAATVSYEAGTLDDAFRRFAEIVKASGQRPFQGEKPDYLKFYKQRAKTGATS